MMYVLKRCLQEFRCKPKLVFNIMERPYSQNYNDVKQSPLKMLLDDAVAYEDASPIDPNNVWATTPYPVKRNKDIEIEKGIEADELSIILFPGQGTHFMGMGKSLIKFPRAREIFDVAKEVLQTDLLKIDTHFDLYKYSQELIVVCSLAAVEKLREERPSALEACVATAGFSLGEITALIFAGAIPLEQGIKLVSVRSAAMHAASIIRPGGMLTILYSPKANINDICNKAVEHCHFLGKHGGFCTVANYLYPSCKVLAGSPEALQYIVENAEDLGIKATKRVKVNGAFHSVGVEAAVEPFKEALKLCDIQTPQIRVISGATVKNYKDADSVRNMLAKQITNPVKWEQVIHFLYQRPDKADIKYPKTFEVGPGKTLRTILRKVNAKAWDSSFSVEV